MYVSTVDTTLGPFTLIVDGDGAVLAGGWTADAEALQPLIHPSLRPPQLRRRKDLGLATRAVHAYHCGELSAIDAVPTRQHSGGAFLSTAWEILRKVEPGRPISYTELASRTGNASASRAAASACARNATALFVPCHRVLRGDGTLGGFRWGLDVKRALLAHEEGLAR